MTLFKKNTDVEKESTSNNIEEDPRDLPQKFRALLSGEESLKIFKVRSPSAPSKFQTPCCPVKIRKKFPSVMVYVMISPNYAVNTCRHAGMRYYKKGKVPVTEERNSFTGIVLQKPEIYPSKHINFRCFSGYYHREKRLYKGKTGAFQALFIRELQSRNGNGFLFDLNGGLEICWTLQRQV